MERKFVQGDNIQYSLMEYEGEVKLLHYNRKTRELEYLEVVVTKSDNPKIIENSTQWISHKNFKYVKLVPTDICNLKYTEREELEKMMSFLQENLIATTRTHNINKALDKRDKQLFMELTKGVDA